jgi:hypothetical protein
MICVAKVGRKIMMTMMTITITTSTTSTMADITEAADTKVAEDTDRKIGRVRLF